MGVSSALPLIALVSMLGCGTSHAPEERGSGGESPPACDASDPCGGPRAAGETCERVFDPCDGSFVSCACAGDAQCSAGVCEKVPPDQHEQHVQEQHQPCDPINPCPGLAQEGGACGAQSAGCPGVTVTCGCAAGLQCVSGSCQRGANAGPCRADAIHCCMPDGRLVRPGGCAPSYPRDVQPATRRRPDGSCEQIQCFLRCLPDTGLVDTPDGPVPVAALRAGDRVFTRDATGARIVRPVLRVSAVPVRHAHAMTELSLADGRVVRASAGHPLLHGRSTFGEVRPGDGLDGARVVGVRTLDYDGTHTWDLLPAGPTGEYWVDGVLVGSTLAR